MAPRNNKNQQGPRGGAPKGRNRKAAQRRDDAPRRSGRQQGSHNDEFQRGKRSGGPQGGYRGGNRGVSLRSGDDVSILEGRHALEEAVETQTPIDVLYVTDSAAADPQLAQTIERAKAQGAKVRFAEPDDLASYSSHGAHQGVVAQLKPYKYGYLRDLVDATKDKENALIVATDHVTDAGNFGAIVRTAEVVGASGILIPNKRNARVNTAAYKTSAGAVMHLPIAMEANLARSLEALKEEGFWVVGASEHAEDVLWDAPLSGRVVLVMGSEGDGLSRITMQACDLLVKLPQLGRVESLNVAQACTAISYEWARQCREAEK